MTNGIILSGGYGTRLRPLTCTIPKTLIPVGNKPVIQLQIELLKEAGVKDIVLAVSVMGDHLKRYFQDGESLGVNLHYTSEKHPMGTAGAIKIAEDFLKDDNFFMLNGDVILNFDFKKMLDKHNNHGGLGTISSRLVEDPSRYGVLITDNTTDLIEKFLEKSEYKPVKDVHKAMPINAGVYILEPEIFSYIEANKKTSIEIDVFPKLAEEKKLYNYPITGIWKDIGKPEELLEGNILLLKELIKKNKSENIIDETAQIDKRVLIYPPNMIGKNVIIKENCILGPNTVIGDNVFIDQDTEIKESLIYNETEIAKNVTIDKTIIADNCLIGDYCDLQGNENSLVILASYVEVNPHIRLIASDFNSLKVCHHEVVKESRSL
ncbi:MAG: sugar phosphate nucleotidyltransferase [Promethearchaeota archaeon]